MTTHPSFYELRSERKVPLGSSLKIVDTSDRLHNLSKADTTTIECAEDLMKQLQTEATESGR